MKVNVKDIDFKAYNAKSLGYKKKEKEVGILGDDTSIVSENMELIYKVQNYWDSLSDFRYRTNRNTMYYNGFQWYETMTHPETGETVTEEDYIKSQGRLPAVHNIIGQMGRNIIGQYRSSRSKPMVVARDREDAEVSEMMTETLNAVHELNSTKELDARNLESFMLSGLPICKIVTDVFPQKDKVDVSLSNVNVNNIFFNGDIQDVLHRDIHTIGEIYDVDINYLCSVFAKSKKEEEEIRNHYQVNKNSYQQTTTSLSSDRMSNVSFNGAMYNNLCRVIEVWYKKGEWKTECHDFIDGTLTLSDLTVKEVEQINEERIMAGIEAGLSPEEIPMIEATEKFTETWYVKYLTPYGRCLFESETPYLHGEHPYAFTLYPFVNGRVAGIVETVIPIQRGINRNISLSDSIIGFSAKGLLLVPENSIPDSMTPEDFASEWTKINGVIVYKSKPGMERPTQITSNSTNVGVHELLALQLGIIEKIMGVSGAIQGQEAKSGTPTSRYQAEAANSTLNSADFFASFEHFRKQRDYKVLKTILQFYTEERSLPQKSGYAKPVRFSPDMVKNVEFDLVISEGQDFAVYRQMTDELLFNLLEKGMIPLKTFLENSSLPFSDKLLSSISKQEQEMQNGQGGQIPPEMMGQMADGAKDANPQAMQMIQQMMGGM